MKLQWDEETIHPPGLLLERDLYVGSEYSDKLLGMDNGHSLEKIVDHKLLSKNG